MREIQFFSASVFSESNKKRQSIRKQNIFVESWDENLSSPTTRARSWRAETANGIRPTFACEHSEKRCLRSAGCKHKNKQAVSLLSVPCTQASAFLASNTAYLTWRDCQVGRPQETSDAGTVFLSDPDQWGIKDWLRFIGNPPLFAKHPVAAVVVSK